MIDHLYPIDLISKSYMHKIKIWSVCTSKENLFPFTQYDYIEKCKITSLENAYAKIYEELQV